MNDIRVNAPRSRSRSVARTARPRARMTSGFTLLEVMVALAILAIALVGLIGRVARDTRISREVAMQDVATELVRYKMYEMEAFLLKEGFPELNDEQDGDFGEQGWPDITWEAVIEKVELPNISAMDELDKAGEDGASTDGASGGGTGSPLDPSGQFDPSAAGGMLGPYYETLKEVLEVSIRKVTVTVKWYVGQEPFEMVVACYFTDPYGMYKVLPQGGF